MPRSIRDELATFFVSAVRIVLYLPLLALRVSARLLLLAATVLPVAVPALAGGFLFWKSEDLTDLVNQIFVGDHLLAKGMAYFVTIGLFVGFLKSVIKMFWGAVRDLLAPVLNILRSGWVPEAVVLASIATTWRDNIARIPGNFALTVRAAALATAAVVAGTILVTASIPFLPSNKVEYVNRYVWVPGTVGTATKDTQYDIKEHLRNDTIFSLIHLKDAQPTSGVGICLDESQRMWLREFRSAVVECAQSEHSQGPDAPLLEVKAFASAAPVKSEGVSTTALNCEIANRRAEAVGAFLAYAGVDEQEDAHRKSWECAGVGEDFQAAKNHCAANPDDDREFHYLGSRDAGENPIFTVRIHRWENPANLQDGKPADDGVFPGNRRYGAELFNRSVHITVPRGFCRPSAKSSDGRPDGREQAASADTEAAEEPPKENPGDAELRRSGQ